MHSLHVHFSIIFFFIFSFKNIYSSRIATKIEFSPITSTWLLSFACLWLEFKYGSNLNGLKFLKKKF
jgi:hypothetical protein